MVSNGKAEEFVEQTAHGHRNQAGRTITAAGKANRGVMAVVWHSAVALTMLILAIAAAGCGGSSDSSPAAPKELANGLWVANRSNNSVVEFKGAVLKTAGVSIPTVAVTNSSSNLDGPLGLTFDSSDNQWIGSRDGNTAGHGSIVEFKLSTLKNLSTTPAPAADVVISDNGTGTYLNAPQLITFERNNLWVANYRSGPTSTGHGFITEYLANQLTASGPTSPHTTQIDTQDFAGPDGLAFDSAGNLFVADFDAGKVWVFKASTVANWSAVGENTPSDAHLSDSTSLQPTAVAFDSGGNLWVSDCKNESGGELYMFPKSSLTTTTTAATTVFTATAITTPNGTDQTLNCPGSIAFDKDGNLWYTNFISNAGAGGSIGEFTKSQLSASGASSPLPNIYLEGDKGLTVFNRPEGLAFGPEL